MYIKKIKLKYFRNYSYQEIDFFSKGNMLFGDNAQGKTNILEAIYVCAVGKSHRQAKDNELVNFRSNGYFIEIDLIKKDRSYKIEVGFRDKEKKIKVAGNELRRVGELPGKLVVVMFSPDDLRMVKDSPAYRRRFIDILICQLYSSYLFSLQQYYKILNQRNSLLKQIKINPQLKSTLGIWDEKIAENGSKIVCQRNEFIRKIALSSKSIHDKLTSGKEELQIHYKNSLIEKRLDAVSEKMLKQKIMEELQEFRDLDIRRGFTSAGPHRDDIEIMINKREAGKFGSQGQQRTAVLSLKLAELDILREEIQENPVLLLDDVFSELDQKRQEFLEEYIKDIQFFITSTDFIDCKVYGKEIKQFRVENGNVSEYEING